MTFDLKVDVTDCIPMQLSSFMCSRIWPSVLKGDSLNALALETIGAFLSRLDLDEYQHQRLSSILPASLSGLKLRSYIISSLGRVCFAFAAGRSAEFSPSTRCSSRRIWKKHPVSARRLFGCACRL